MGCRDFESGSANGIRSATTGYSTLGTAHTHALLCTVESMPGGGTFAVLCGLIVSPADTANAAMLFYADGGPTFSVAVGTNLVVPGSAMNPSTGAPYLFVCAKNAGTVAPRFLMHNYATQTTTYDAAGGTVANRSTGAGTGCIGVSTDDSSPFDGQIGAAAQWNRGLPEAEMRALIGGRQAWRAAFGRGVLTSGEFFVDLTQPGTIRDQLNPSIAYTAGTQPAFGPDAIRFPGW